MRPTSLALAGSLTALIALTACSSDDEPDAATSRLAAVTEAGTLKVCTTGDYRPFSYLDPSTKKYSGIDVTMAQDLAKRLGVTVTWVPTTWKTLMADFTGKCDIAVGGISISTDRAEQAFFTDPLLTEGKTPITLCDNVRKYDTIKEINKAGVRSITPIGGTNEKFADAHYPKGEIIRWEDNNTIFDEIIEGRADVMTTDASETVWVANEHPELCAVHPDKPFDFSQKGYLLPLGDVAFQQYVDQWLNIARHDGTYDKAQKPWFGNETLD